MFTAQLQHGVRVAVAERETVSNQFCSLEKVSREVLRSRILLLAPNALLISYCTSTGGELSHFQHRWHSWNHSSIPYSHRYHLVIFRWSLPPRPHAGSCRRQKGRAIPFNLTPMIPRMPCSVGWSLLASSADSERALCSADAGTI